VALWGTVVLRYGVRFPPIVGDQNTVTSMPMALQIHHTNTQVLFDSFITPQLTQNHLPNQRPQSPSILNLIHHSTLYNSTISNDRITMSFLYSPTPLLRTASRQTPRLFSTAVIYRKSATDSVKDGLKAVDRTVSDTIVYGIDKASKLSRLPDFNSSLPT